MATSESAVVACVEASWPASARDRAAIHHYSNSPTGAVRPDQTEERAGRYVHGYAGDRRRRAEVFPQVSGLYREDSPTPEASPRRTTTPPGKLLVFPVFAGEKCVAGVFGLP